ncbi:MAG: aminoacyl-histidine dipeptidase [Candidatus Aminicenantes bacterium]|nr:aminoacyl-histidine dipeptidase [Candidatus Aminicenantes bacterium]
MENVSHEKTKDILKWFEEISKIPRCSKQEDKIVNYLIEWSKENGFEYNIDNVQNIVIKVPATSGMENSPIIVIQGHLDMVCEKTPDSDHDFTKDPIKLVYDGEWLTADRTTLGSDNGIAIAMAMAAALDKDLEHPPLELLFTVDEETGLTGANALAPGFIEGKLLLNIDSEDEGVFTVGCAGGINTDLTLPVDLENIPSGYNEFKLMAGGMKGGHSGIDIALGKANAIKVIARAINSIVNQGFEVLLSDIKGGSAHNAIPRDAEAVLLIKDNDLEKIKEVVSDNEQTIKFEHSSTDPDLEIKLVSEDGSSASKAVNSAGIKKICDFVLAIPHGVFAMSADIDDLVETSNNLANIKIENGKVMILTSQRSSLVSRLDALTNSIEAIARLAGGEGKSGDGYPPWEPNMDSPLLAKSVKLYERMYNKKPVVEVIHAGLECGIIGDKNPGMDMLSIGPTLKYPHSPDEKIHVGTVGLVWDFMAELLKELA